MAITLRRRLQDPHHLPNKTSALPTPSKSSLLSVPTSFLLSILLTIWCCSVLLSNSFHICFSSRKLNVYCITGGTGSDNLHLTRSLSFLPSSNSSLTNRTMSNFELIRDLFSKDQETIRHTQMAMIGSGNRTSTTEAMASNNLRKKEIADAIKFVEENMRTIRSWATTATSTQPSCNGRGFFVYDLPSKFNKDLLDKCGELLPWADLCEHFANNGIGLPMSGSDLGPGWHRTHQYSLEPIFHSRVLNHPCRVMDATKAQLFYVPFYAGLDVLRWHFVNASGTAKDELSTELVRWLEAQPEWARRGGRDHMFVLGKISWDFRRAGGLWGSNFLSLTQMQAPYKFLIERQPWEVNEIGVPHPTNFHPHSDDDIIRWQARVASAARETLVSFVGAARPNEAESIRSALIRQCEAAAEGGECRFLDCGSGGCREPSEVVATFMRSEFCLQPPGDSPTRKSVFDGMVAGCIPVLFDPFTAYYQYPWHLPKDHHKFSVFVDKEKVRQGSVDVVETLRAVPPEQREEMRRFIIYELMPGLVYGDPGSEFRKFRDAFAIVMDNMIELVSKNKG